MATGVGFEFVFCRINFVKKKTFSEAIKNAKPN